MDWLWNHLHRLRRRHALKRIYMKSSDHGFANAAFCEFCEQDLVGRYTAKGRFGKKFCKTSLCSSCYNNAGFFKKQLKLDVSPCDICEDHTYSKGYIMQKMVNGKRGGGETKDSDSEFDLSMSLHICADCKPTSDAKCKAFAEVSLSFAILKFADVCTTKCIDECTMSVKLIGF